MRGSEKGSEGQTIFNLAMENVLKSLPDKIRDQLSRQDIIVHTNAPQMYTFLNHFQIARSWR